MKELPFISVLDQRHESIALEEYEAVACTLDANGCLTCGDVAVPVTVTRSGHPDAVCSDAHGNEGKVAVELIGPVEPGDRLLVHAGVAIERLDGA
jgi:hydrogenase expression/formation protein HypC